MAEEDKKVVKIIIDGGEFVPVDQDHWFTDLLKKAKLHKGTICGVVEITKEHHIK